MIKQLKNRWGDISYYRRFLVGIERAKMKIYELEESAQDNVNLEAPSGGGGQQVKKNWNDSSPVFDKTDIGMRLNKRKPGQKVFRDVALT